MSHTAKILLLGSGELGREFVISAKRLGAYVVACDAYDDAPAMQVADAREVFSMLDAEKLRSAVETHRPDFIVPEIEAIRTEVLAELEAEGFAVVPSARAAQLTMNRDAIRDLAANELGLTTSRYRYASTLDEVRESRRIRRLSLRDEAGHVLEREGPEHGPCRSRAGSGMGYGRPKHARGPQARDRRAIHRLRL